MTIHEGELYWVQLPAEPETPPRIPHPHVVIQVDEKTVMVCALTTNAKKISMPGNIPLDMGEGNLPKASIIEVAKVITIDKGLLGDRIGAVNALPRGANPSEPSFCAAFFLRPLTGRQHMPR